MVARQRERSAGGGRGGRCAWERRPQGVEPLGVILSLSPCPPRRFFRHAWGCAPPRRGRGRGELLPPSPPPPGPTPTTRTLTLSPPFLSSLQQTGGLAVGGNTERGARPPAGGRRAAAPHPPTPPSPAAGRAGGRGGGPQPLGHPEHPAAGARRSHPLPCLVPSSGSFPRF